MKAPTVCQPSRSALARHTRTWSSIEASRWFSEEYRRRSRCAGHAASSCRFVSSTSASISFRGPALHRREGALGYPRGLPAETAKMRRVRCAAPDAICLAIVLERDPHAVARDLGRIERRLRRAPRCARLKPLPCRVRPQLRPNHCAVRRRAMPVSPTTPSASPWLPSQRASAADAAGNSGRPNWR